MRPRVHRYFANKVKYQLHLLTEMPEDFPNEYYQSARKLAGERLVEAYKAAMLADMFTRRGLRTDAAKAWWSFRSFLRRAELLVSCTRIFYHTDPSAPETP